MTTPAKKKSLIQKLALACDAVKGISKNGRNEYHHYNYVKAADVAKAIRHQLFRRNVMLLADEKEITTREILTNQGGKTTELTLRIEYTLYDGDSDQKITTTAFGVAMDTGDKAIYKAKTGALKYFLRGLGIIPDERDDPEADESVDEQTDERLGENYRPPKKGKAKKVADYQCRAFDSATHSSGKTAQQVATYLKQKFNCLAVADLSPEDFKLAIKWAVGTESLEETLTTSVKAVEKKIPEFDVQPESRRYEAV